MLLRWSGPGVTLSPELKLLQYNILPLQLQETHAYTGEKNGNFSRLVVYFRFERQIGHHLIQTFAPSTLVVVLSWFSFWLDLDAIPARVTLLVTCLLTLVTMFTGLRSDIPAVAYVKALDLWMAFCMISVFASLGEFVIVKVFQGKYNALKIKEKEYAKICQETAITQWTNPTPSPKYAHHFKYKNMANDSFVRLYWKTEKGKEKIMWKEVDRTSMKFVHETPKQPNRMLQSLDYFDVNPNATLSKRKAAKTAMRVLNLLSKEKSIDEYNKYYITELDLKEGFVKELLQRELSENKRSKCKFKNCEFETDDIKHILEHLESCDKKPAVFFTCKKCFSTCETEEGMVTHLTTIHNVEIVDEDFKANYDEEDDEDEEDYENDLRNKELRKKMFFERKKLTTDSNYKIKPACLYQVVTKRTLLFSHSLVYTMNFCGKYYQKPTIFDDLRYSPADWLLLDEELVEEYLPKTGESCDVAYRKITDFENVFGDNYEFKNYELFDSDLTNQGVTIFCGGPVNALAWMPTPHTFLNKNQILAVASCNDFNKKYLVEVNYNEPSVIQFWDFGILKNKNPFSQPRLLFCLACDFGPVWHMEWCPSGCFDLAENSNLDDNMSRMGLLAVAGTNSKVCIYSIPCLKEEHIGVIYKVKPVLNLCLTLENGSVLGKAPFYPTKISWSKALGHRYIAVGYTNGMVGIFDLDTKSKLLRHKGNDGVDVLLPYKSFQAHFYYISVLELVPLSGGNKFLLTGSFDRDVIVWDLINDNKMTISKKTCIISDGLWLSNWIASITTADESSSNFSLVHSRIRSFRHYMYEHAHLTSSAASILSLSSSSWLNGILHASSVGEIVAMFPSQLLYSLDSDKKFKSYKYLMGYAKLIDKHLTPEERVAEEILKQKALKHVPRTTDKVQLNIINTHYNKYEPMTYQEANKKYGLLFCDIDMEKMWVCCKDMQEKLSRSHEQLEVAKPNLYSLQAVNKIAFNPNLQASLFYATGHQAGFVRMTYMKFLENDPQII